MFLQVYNIEKVAEACELPGAFVVGAGAGPAHKLGVNSEVKEDEVTFFFGLKKEHFMHEW